MPKILGRRSTPSKAIIVTAPRASFRARGYDARWDNYSRRLRREIGICERCDRLGRTRVCEVVDHKTPVTAGGSMWDRENHWVLCAPCHSWKQSLELHAIKTDQVHMLRFWCDNPEELPRRFRETPASG